MEHYQYSQPHQATKNKSFKNQGQSRRYVSPSKNSFHMSPNKSSKFKSIKDTDAYISPDRRSQRQSQRQIARQSSLTKINNKNYSARNNERHNKILEKNLRESKKFLQKRHNTGLANPGLGSIRNSARNSMRGITLPAMSIQSGKTYQTGTTMDSYQTKSKMGSISKMSKNKDFQISSSRNLEGKSPGKTMSQSKFSSHNNQEDHSSKGVIAKYDYSCNDIDHIDSQHHIELSKPQEPKQQPQKSPKKPKTKKKKQKFSKVDFGFGEFTFNTSSEQNSQNKSKTSSRITLSFQLNPNSKSKKASDDFLSIISSRLCLLDYEISCGHDLKHVKINTNDKNLKKLKKSYFQFLKNFSLIDGVVDSVFIYSVVLAKRVKKALISKFEFKQKEFMLIYAGCLFLSIKYVIDSHKWFVEDFSHISQLDEKLIHKMEIFVIETALNFKVAVMNDEFIKEHKKTYKNVQRRLRRVKCAKIDESAE